MPATIRDVALKAGVSPATVSKALNGSGSVAEETQQKIRQAAKALGYQPNARARNFATRATYQMRSLQISPLTRLLSIRTCSRSCAAFSIRWTKKATPMVMKHLSSKDAIAYMEQAWSQHLVDGFVLHMSVMTKKLSALISRENIPHIVIGKPNFDNHLCWIDTDNCLSGGARRPPLAELATRTSVCRRPCRRI